MGFGVEHFRHLLRLRSSLEEPLMPMEGDDYEFFRDVRVPNVTLKEKSFLQRNE